MHKPKQGSSAKGLKREYIFDILLYSKNGLFAVAERQEVDLNSNDENMNQKKLSEVDPIAWIQDVYDSVPCGIMRFRVRGNQQELLSANKTALTMSGIESIEMLATIVKMGFFTSSEDADNSLEAYYYELVNIGDTMVIEKSFVNKEGKLRWFRGNNTLLDKKEDERIVQLICYDVTAEKEQEIKDAAIKVYEIMGCRGLSRVDFFLKESGRVIFNEINTIPGFTHISMYPKLWEESGIPYDELIDELIRLALER